MTDAPRTQKPADPLFIDEVHGHQARYKKIVAFTHSATKAAGIMPVSYTHLTLPTRS